MRRTLILGVLATLLLSVSAYVWTSRVPPPVAGQQQAVPGALLHEIARKKKLLREVPGRTGILAQESRYSLYDEELVIRDFFQDRRGGFFVDVGCAWPIRANNTYYLEKHLGWKGIGIDALEDYAAAWKKERPASRFFSYLVTNHSGTQETFFKSQDSGLSSTNSDWASGKVFGDKMKAEQVQIPSITLNDLLEREGVAKVDLLSMDIEGHEPEALEGFDIDRYRPELVVIEGKVESVARYFEQHGYELVERYLPFDDVNRYFRRKPEGAADGSNP